MDSKTKLPNGFIDSDYVGLDQTVNQKKFYRLADVKSRIEKVAFDVVRFTDSEDLDKLWIIREENGDKVLVAMYEDDSNKEITVKASWAAIPDKTGNVNVFYKGDPITKIAVEQMGIPKEDNALVSRSLPNKLASDKSFVSSMLSSLSVQNRSELYSKYPELKG
jgi:hypothetical protein